MQLDLTTFLLEIVNFLVLVWLLKRFLYQPIRSILQQRAAEVARTLAEAAAKCEDAKSLEERHQKQLAEWEQEKAKQRTALAGEIAVERNRLEQDLREEIDRQREKERVLAGRRAEEQQRVAEAAGAASAVKFAARLLKRMAGPEVETRIAGLVVEDLAALPPARRDELRRAIVAANGQVKIASALALSDAQRAAVIAALGNVAGGLVAADFEQDASLLAGLRIAAGSSVVHANLRDELAYFAEAVSHG
ncbi:MAG: F0F1 ATP synthase subunit delta [Bryobacteraceae bacterium]